MTTLSVVVPTWNSARFVEPCLESVRADDPDAEIVTVDNGSHDGSPQLAERFGEVVRHSENRGFAVAVNAGVRRARGEHVLVLNVDTVLEPGALGALAGVLRADPGLLAVQPLLLQADTSPPLVYSAGQQLLADGRAYELGAGRAPDGGALREVAGVCGAAAMFRREAFLALGGYEERLFAFHEDVELNMRARMLGWRLACCPQARVTHVGNAVWRSAARRPAAFNTRLVARNRLATSIKILPLRVGPAVVLVEIASLLLAARRGVLWPALSGRIEALSWLPSLLHARRALRRDGEIARLEPWLARPHSMRVPAASAV